MAHFRNFTLIAAAAILGAPSLPSASIGASAPDLTGWPKASSDLSVMTFNVKGLPWPIASGRPMAFSGIAERLRLMRSQGIQPHIVVLQETFTQDAKRIGALAGYANVTFGSTIAPATRRSPLGVKFGDEAQTIKGEGVGAVLDSGLTILSDYPIVKTARLAFPAGACAGFDCLAAKGVLVAWVKLPGNARPLAIVNTHLNSGRAALVPTERSNKAHVWQVGAIRAFLAKTISKDTPVIFGGDFNIGDYPERRAALAKPMIDGAQRDDLNSVIEQGRVPASSRSEMLSILNRNLDKMFSRSGGGLSLTPSRAWVPFGLAATSRPLSDHAGFIVEYSYPRT
jgi:endonuclease/exonuclease/phosphatase family metal-dependent hydrolase